MALSKQEVFNKVALHLLKQYAVSNDLEEQTPEEQMSSNCKYRSPTGLMCAVGALIPDDVYTEEMERKNTYRLLDEFPKFRDLFDEEVRKSTLLSDLQAIHDDTSVDGWYFLLVNLANNSRHGLNTNVLHQRDAF